jgi:hypothetical protein
MKIVCELIVERDGKEVFRGKSKSFVQNFAIALMTMLASPASGIVSGIRSSGTVTKTDGSTTTIWGEWYSAVTNYGGGTPLALYGGDNDDSQGVVVGAGSASVSPTDYSLASKISHGTGAGQLDYEPQTVTSSYSDTSSYVEVARSFINRSDADVVVREVGLIARNYWKDVSAVRNDVKFLIARDVLPTPVTVKPLGSLTVRYRISLSL